MLRASFSIFRTFRDLGMDISKVKLSLPASCTVLTNCSCLVILSDDNFLKLTMVLRDQVFEQYFWNNGRETRTQVDKVHKELENSGKIITDLFSRKLNFKHVRKKL